MDEDIVEVYPLPKALEAPGVVEWIQRQLEAGRIGPAAVRMIARDIDQIALREIAAREERLRRSIAGERKWQ
jgi:hypothetical protein